MPAESDLTPGPAAAQPGEVDPAPAPAPDVLDDAGAGDKVIRGGALLSASYIVTMLLTAASVPLMIRALGPEDIGVFVTASSAVMIVAGLTEVGLNNIGTREYVLVEGEQRRFVLRNLVGMRLTLTVAGLVLACALMAALGYRGIVVLGVVISGAGLVLTAVQQSWTIPLAGTLRWGAVSLLDLIRGTVTAALVVVLGLASAEVTEFFFISVAAAGTVLAVTAYVVRHDLDWRLSFNTVEWRRLVKDALPYAAATTVTILYFRVALMVLSLIGDADETGYYSAAFKIVEILGGFAGLLVGVAFPVLARAARDDSARLRYAITKVTETNVVFGAFLSLIVFVSAPLAIDLVAGDDFKPSVDVLRVQSVTITAGFSVAALSYGLLALRRHRELLAGSGIALLTAVVGALVLIPSHGALGAAWATVIAEFTLMVAFGVLLARAQPDLRLSPWIWLRAVLVLAIAGAVGLLLPVSVILATAAAALVYAGLIAVLGGIPEELWTAVRSRVAALSPRGG